jgi:YVTN family beta-propeller protein
VIKVGRRPDAIAAAPDGKTVYVVNGGSGTVTPISVTTDSALPAIRVGKDPTAIVIGPGGKAAYVLDAPAGRQGAVVPVRLATGRAGKPIQAGWAPAAISLTLDGRTALVADWGIDTSYVTPVSTVTGKAGKAIKLPGTPYAVVVAPGGRFAYVAGAGRMVETPHGENWQGVLTPIKLPGLVRERPVVVGQDIYQGNEAPVDVVFNQRGTMAYAVYTGINALVPVDTSTGRAGKAIPVARYPVAAVSVQGGRWIYVSSAGAPVTEVTPADGARKTIRAGAGPAGPPSPVLDVSAASADGRTVYVLGWNGRTAGTMTPIRVPVGTAEKPVTVGRNPVAMAIVP